MSVIRCWRRGPAWCQWRSMSSGTARDNAFRTRRMDESRSTSTVDEEAVASSWTPQLPLYAAFLRRPSAGLAVRILRQEFDVNRAMDVFERVMQSGAHVSVPFFQSMMAFCRARAPAKAPAVLRAALSYDVQVTGDPALFCTFLDACSASKPPLLDDALKMYSNHGPRSGDVIVRLATMCLMAKQPGAALPLVQDAVDNCVDISDKMFSLFAACCAGDGSPAAGDTASTLLKLVRLKCIVHDRNLVAYENLIKVFLSANRSDEAAETLHLMDANGLTPSVETRSTVNKAYAQR
ncbi:Pentacotripeptide-repeat region of PRORP domain-containing protein [Plasmodiophora brassicae]